MHKKLFISLIMLILLAGCSLPGNRASEDAAMATKVAEIIASNVPPATSTIIVPPVVEPTLPLVIEQTLPPTEEPAPTESAAPTEEPTPEATLAPTEAATAVPATAAPGTTIPTAAVTPLASVTAGPTATLSSTDLRTQLGNATDTDPMDNANKWFWPVGADKFTSASWSNGMMNLTGLTDVAGWRLPLVQNSTNMAIEMTAKSGECSGLDSYGLFVRIPVFSAPNQGYLYEVSCDGQYRFWKWDGKVGEKGTATTLVAWKASDKIVKGSNAVNRLGIWANGSNFKLYVNGVFLEEVTNSSFDSGSFGVFVKPGPTAKYTIQVDEVSYWLNPKP